MNKLIGMPTHSVDKSVNAQTKELLERIELSQKREIRFAFDNSLIDTHALACIKVANQLGLVEFAKEMISEMEEREVSNG